MKRILKGPVLLLIPLLPWIILSDFFFFPRYSDYSDLVISHLSNAHYIAQSLAETGRIPLWSDAILSGYPLAANPLAGIWYPPGWLVHFFPLHIGFNLLVLTHLLWGGWGMMVLLRKMGLKTVSFLLGGLAFMMMPKTFAHFAAGHVTLIFAIAWTPWLIVAEKHLQEHGNHGFVKWLLPGSVLGLIGLADLRWLPYAFVLWLGFSATGNFASWTSRNLAGVKKWSLKLITSMVVGFLLIAAILFPLLEYSRISTRASMEIQDILSFSLPPEELLGLIVPDFGGFAEWVVYPGAIVLGLTIYTITITEVRKRCWFWIILLMISLVLSLGSSIPFMETIAGTPGFSLLRVPPRALFLAGFAFSILAAQGLDDLLDRKKLNFPDPVFFIAPLAAFVIFIMIGIAILGEKIPLNMVWGGVALVLTILIIAFKERDRLSVQQVTLWIPILLIVDLTGVNLQAVDLKGKNIVYGEGYAAAAFLASQPGIFRVYTPSNSIPQQTAVLAELEMANGIDPLQLAEYSNFMRIASGVNYQGYSVTIPPFEGGDPRTANQKARPIAEMLAVLNVRYIVSAYALDVPGILLVWQENGTFVYEHQSALPRAWVQPQNVPIGEQYQAAEILERSPGYLKIDAEGSGLLVLSEIEYPGWRVLVDGKPEEILRVANLFRGVIIPTGRHEVEFSFNPVSIRIGTALSIMGWLAIMSFFVIDNRRKH